jgi:hypothetical protein
MGAFTAMAALILFGGRTYYLALLRAALGGAKSATLDEQSIWAARVFLLASAALSAILTINGIPWLLSLIWIGAMTVVVLVMCRLVAEMGIPWTPLGDLGPLQFLVYAIGETALGAKAYSLLAIFQSILLPSNVTMLPLAPAVMNAVRVEETVTGRSRSVSLAGPFVLVALAVTLALFIWIGYSTQGESNDYPTRTGTTEVMRAASSITASLAASGDSSASAVNRILHTDIGFRNRLASIQPAEGFIPFFTIGCTMVLLTGLARLRFPRFPLQPLPLVLVGSWIMSRFWVCFLIGWLIKTSLLKIGGTRLFEKNRPFFVGIFCGQALIFTFWIVVDLVLYRKNNYTFDRKWLTIFDSIYSS